MQVKLLLHLEKDFDGIQGEGRQEWSMMKSKTPNTVWYLHLR